jgi:hypothetical protein
MDKIRQRLQQLLNAQGIEVPPARERAQANPRLR